MELEFFIKLCEPKPLKLTDTTRLAAPHSYAEAYQLIRNTLCGKATDTIKTLDLLKKRLAIRGLRKNLNHDYYIRIINCLSESVRRYEIQGGEVCEKPDWATAISLTLQYRDEFHYFNPQIKTDFDERIQEFAHAYVNLENYGVRFVEKDLELHINEDSYELINAKVHEHCKFIGGKNLLSSLFHYLSPEYKTQAKRFVGLRKIQINGKKIKAEIPYGYLLAVGAKHIGDKGNEDHNDEFLSLLSLCRDLTTIFEIQPYSQFETLFLSAHGLIRYLQEAVWYDNLISFSQLNSDYAKKILDRLTEKFQSNDLTSRNIKLRDALRVAESLIKLAKAKVGTTVTIQQICTQSKVKKFLVEKILSTFLSFRPHEVNTSLEFPPISDNINYCFKPAVAMSGAYYLYPKSICSLGSLNAILNLIVTPDGQRSKGNDRLLGYELEDFLREEFSAQNFKIAYGESKGKSGMDDFECDLIVETDNIVFIFEIKKKGLTRKAMSGDEVSLLSDLADSLMHSHQQAMKIEYWLKNRKTIHLDHKKTLTSISLNGRKTKRISVSLSDFGALQDKISLQNILLHASDTTLKHPEEELDSRLNKWRGYTGEIRRLANLNDEYDGQGIPFYDSFFMSVPQILTILANSESNSNFESHMLGLNSMTSATRNFYREFFYRLDIFNPSN